MNGANEMRVHGAAGTASRVLIQHDPAWQLCLPGRPWGLHPMLVENSCVRCGWSVEARP